MAKVSFRWKQILYLILGKSKVKLKRDRFWRKGSWLFILAGVAIMFLWNWMLLMATVTGVGMMLLVYLIPGWQRDWSNCQKYFSHLNRKLTLAVGSGGGAAFAIYMAASIWVDTENRWLAVGVILQFLATIITLALLLWHITTHQTTRHEVKYDQLLQDLTNIDPLKRLIAVRQLTNLVTNTRLSNNLRVSLLEYFRLMLSVETEPVIREAVLESLQIWGEFNNEPPLAMPINFQRSTHRVSRHIINEE